MKVALPGPITETCSWHGFVIGLAGSTVNRIDHERWSFNATSGGIERSGGEAQGIIAVEGFFLCPYGPDNACHFIGEQCVEIPIHGLQTLIELNDFIDEGVKVSLQNVRQIIRRLLPKNSRSHERQRFI